MRIPFSLVKFFTICVLWVLLTGATTYTSNLSVGIPGTGEINWQAIVNEWATWIDDTALGYVHVQATQQTPTRTSDNSFTVKGDRTALYIAGRRLKLLLAGPSTVRTGVSSSTYSGGQDLTSVITVDSVVTATITTLYVATTDNLTFVPVARTIATSAPLTGGGDLSADRTLSLSLHSNGALSTISGSLSIRQDCASGQLLVWTTAWNCTATAAATPHAILSATHSDTTVGTVVRGDLITGQTATPVWQRLVLGTNNQYVKSNATDVLWATIASTEITNTTFVTSVTGTAPIASSGGLTPAISLNDTAVTPASYTYASITVDQKGRLTAASSGTAAVTAVTATAPITSTGGLTPVIACATCITAAAPTDAEYWVATANATLSAERNLGLLTTGLVLNTVTAAVGVPSAYAGTSCTNQFPRSLNASGAATCASVSLTADISGILPLAGGGTNANLTASNGGIFYSTASAGAILSGTATANQVLLSGVSTTPAWSTATYPATTTINRILYSSAASVISEITTANSGILVTSSGGVPSIATDIPTAVTIGGAYVYRVSGTDVALADGGTSASLTASNGGIFYSTASAGAILSGTATANQVLLSGLSTTPAWSTATYPATTTINRILYSSAASVISEITTANSGVLVTSGAGVPSIATDIPTAVTIGTAYIYRVGGTDVAVADGGTGVGTFTLNGVLYGNSATSVLVTAQGAANTVLTANAGAPSFSATPTITSATLTANTNFLVAGTTNTTTFTMAVLAASRTFTLPDANSNPVQPLACSGTDKVSAIAATGVVTCSADVTAGSPTWDTIGNPAAAQALTMGANNTTWTWNSSSGVFKSSHTSAFGATTQWLIEQITGNPTAGVLFELKAADTDVTIFKAGDGTNGITLTQAGLLAKAGTGSIRADDVVCTTCVASADLAVANKTINKSIDITSPTTADTNKIQIYWPAAVTLDRVVCSTDVGTVTIQFDERAEATPNTAGVNSLTASLVCDTNSEITTSFSDSAIAADVPHNLQITATASSPTVVRIHVRATIN